MQYPSRLFAQSVCTVDPTKLIIVQSARIHQNRYSSFIRENDGACVMTFLMCRPCAINAIMFIIVSFVVLAKLYCTHFDVHCVTISTLYRGRALICVTNGA